MRHDLWVLSDEAYANIRFDGGEVKSIASRRGMRAHTVILFTCSKQFAMTGWRLGAAVGDAEVIAQISRLNTNMESCATHFIQRALGETLRDCATADFRAKFAEIRAKPPPNPRNLICEKPLTRRFLAYNRAPAAVVNGAARLFYNQIKQIVWA
ncbi:MAG: aminotransferase class I/II-fold pyridoxal phosphate-dependent enzyme, partial [Alphaproteobacteria bacterium]|nr:aminotransferase class I/II-fold pyridoxal phosphate-dependent enzyme [Alphaproteobacteria bacterium]